MGLVTGFIAGIGRGARCQPWKELADWPQLGLILHSLTLPLYSRRRVRFTFVKPNREDLAYLGGLAQSGQLRTVIDSVHPLVELPAAFMHGQTGRARGKIIVAVKA